MESRLPSSGTPYGTGQQSAQNSTAGSARADARDVGEPVSPAILSALQGLMWPSHLDDTAVARWHGQGFVWSEYKCTRFGLLQTQGGPCGVLAAVQAYLLTFLLFEEGSDQGEAKTRGTEAAERVRALIMSESGPSDEQRSSALLSAMVAIVCHCRPEADRAGFCLVTCSEPPFTRATQSAGLRLHRTSDERQLRALIQEHMAQFQTLGGVILLMFAVIMTRGVQQIRSDMDEPGALTAEHGHCTQEIMNLLLTGAAVSQIFDGTRPLGDTGLVLRGITKQPRVGFLTFLEAMRYCQVGSYYKNPKFPVFVIGSVSHITTCWCGDAALLQESAATKLERRVKRAFNQFDASENGFITLDKLVPVLQLIGHPYDSPAAQGNLQLQCDPDGLGVVLWRTFWAALSQHSEESESSRVWEQHCKRAFANFDEHQNGFIATSALPGLLALIGSPLSERDPAALAARCDVDGLGILLWSSFWAIAVTVKPAIGVASNVFAAVAPAGNQQRTMYHYNGLKRIIRGEDHGPRCVSFRITTFDNGEIGGSLPARASKFEQTVRTRFKGALVDWQGQEPSSIDG